MGAAGSTIGDFAQGSIPAVSTRACIECCRTDSQSEVCVQIAQFAELHVVGERQGRHPACSGGSWSREPCGTVATVRTICVGGNVVYAASHFRTLKECTESEARRPGVLQHVTARGITRGAVFVDHDDRADLLARIGDTSRLDGLCVLAWHSCPITFTYSLGRATLGHPGRSSESSSRFNRRHRRRGPLFQNRCGSTLLTRGRERWAFDERVLGSREFVRGACRWHS